MRDKILLANEQYSRQVEALLQEMGRIPSERLNQKPAGNGWSAIQTMHHLILVEAQSLAYLHKKLSFNPDLPKAGWAAGLKMIFLKWTLASPIKFKAPKSVGNDKLPEQDTLENVSAKWQQVRQSWTDLLTQMPDNLLDKAVYRHPRIGLINWLQTIDFIASHFKRHKAQILRAIS
ncbi:MAG TPA: DinB family protein [Saprospiraceae bacterium]|nr:DinB family protein [Saprospiraceae bacterium]